MSVKTWKHFTGTKAPETTVSAAYMNAGLSAFSYRLLVNSGGLDNLTKNILNRINHALPGELSFVQTDIGWVLYGDTDVADSEITNIINKTIASADASL